MTNEQTVAALVDWADSVLPELGQPRSAPETDWPLPDIACAITRCRLVAGRVQQRLDQLRDVELLVAVHPEPHDAASSQLYGFIDRLMDSVLKDNTLGGRVGETVRDGLEGRFEPPFVETDDGATARQATLVLTVRDFTGVA